MDHRGAAGGAEGLERVTNFQSCDPDFNDSKCTRQGSAEAPTVRMKLVTSNHEVLKEGGRGQRESQPGRDRLWPIPFWKEIVEEFMPDFPQEIGQFSRIPRRRLRE